MPLFLTRFYSCLTVVVLFFWGLQELDAQPITDASGDIVVGGILPDPAAIFDLQSTTKGMLIPRLNNIQRDAIVAPVEGLIIYNTDIGTLQTWSDASGIWQWDAFLTTGSNFGWFIIGNGGLTDGVDNFFGTTDAVPVRVIVDNAERMILNTNGSIQRDAGGDLRGVDAVDMQVSRASPMEVASGDYATIGGGIENSATSGGAVVGGGSRNSASGSHSTVGGGQENRAVNNYSTIGGGRRNSATTSYATIGGGTDNRATGSNAVVGGGLGNISSGSNSTVGGGNGNSATTIFTTVGGGVANAASGFISTIAGGERSTAAGDRATIGGGMRNHASGDYSVVVGGRGLTLGPTASGSFGFLGGNSVGSSGDGSNRMKVDAQDVAVFGNTDLWLANNDNAASQLRFYEAKTGAGSFPNGANYTSFEAGAQAANINYILPTTTSSTTTIEEGILQLDQTTGQLSWVDPITLGVPGWALSGNPGTTPGTDYLGTSDAQALHIYANGGTDNSLILNTNGSIQRDVGGNARGINAVDMQIARTAVTHVASGRGATIVGGRQNTASGDYSVAMGARTVASGPYSVAMGQNARASGGGSFAAGDIAQAQGGSAFAIGWNTQALGHYSYAIGRNAKASADYAMAIGAGSEAAGVGTTSMGIGLNLRGGGSFGFLGNNPTFSRPMQVTASNTAVFGNTDLWLANNDNAASQLRFYEAKTGAGSFPNGANYTSFEAGVQAANINYILPTTTSSTTTIEEGILQLDQTTGQLSWVDPTTLDVPAWALSGNAGTTPGTDYLGTSDAQALHIYANGGTDNSLILNTNGSIQRDVGGNARGEDAVDMQITRTSPSQVASGRWATIVGGYQNTASGIYAVAMGRLSTASGSASVAMGQAARATGGGSLAVGTGSEAAGGSATAIGDNTKALSHYSYALGRNAKTNAQYAMAIGASTEASGVGTTAMGIGLNLQGQGSFGFLGNNTTFSSPMRVTASNVAVLGNTDLWLANNDNSASQLRFYEANSSTGNFPAGTNYTSFKAGAQTTNISYTLPTSIPNGATAGTDLGSGYMESNSAGALSWRQSVVQTATNINFGTVAAQSSSDVTVTVTGAAVGDIVNLGVDNAAVLANSSYTAWVSAADTITIRFNNYSIGVLTPVTTNTFKVQVTK